MCVIDDDFYEELAISSRKFIDRINQRAGELGYTARTIAIAAKLDSDIFDDVEHVFDRLDIFDLHRIRCVLGCKTSDLLED
jgi:hypothetical protein